MFKHYYEKYVISNNISRCLKYIYIYFFFVHNFYEIILVFNAYLLTIWRLIGNRLQMNKIPYFTNENNIFGYVLLRRFI